MRVNVRWVTSVLICTLAFHAGEGSARPAELTTLKQERVGPSITLRHLAEITDIDSFSVSPDGQSFLIGTRRADPDLNRYVLSWVLGSVDGRAVKIVADGGDPIFIRRPGRLYIGGEIAASGVEWSGDGKWYAVSIQKDKKALIVTGTTDGRIMRTLEASQSEIEKIKWIHAGKTLGVAQTSSAEAVTSWDGVNIRDLSSLDEIVGLSASASIVDTSAGQTTWWVHDVETGTSRRATTEEIGQLNQPVKPRSYLEKGGVMRPADLSSAIFPPASDGGKLIAILKKNPSDKGSLPKVTLLVGDGTNLLKCMSELCSGYMFKGLWWYRGALYILRTDPSSFKDQIVRYSPQTQTVSNILRDDVRLQNCSLVAEELICIRTRETEPADIAAFNLSNSRFREILNVNPAFETLGHGRIDAISWDVETASSLGFPPKASGYVLYPTGYVEGQRYPLIVAPYQTGGFHRGGVGDEQPLRYYTTLGFVVLDISFPVPWGSFSKMSPAEAEAAQFGQGLPMLQVPADSTIKAISILVDRGIVDPDRVGIGGISWASEVILYAARHRGGLAALSLGQCGGNREAVLMQTATGRQKMRKFRGKDLRSFPDPLSEKGTAWWNARTFDGTIKGTPPAILFNLADREAVACGSIFHAMNMKSIPFEAYVYPNEYHTKWQPAHRLSVYQRNVDWFRYWLQNFKDPSPAKTELYRQWDEIRERIRHSE